jgi:hypothetical protein
MILLNKINYVKKIFKLLILPKVDSADILLKEQN